MDVKVVVKLFWVKRLRSNEDDYEWVVMCV